MGRSFTAASLHGIESHRIRAKWLVVTANTLRTSAGLMARHPAAPFPACVRACTITSWTDL